MIHIAHDERSAGEKYTAPRIKTVQLYSEEALLQSSITGESLMGIGLYSIDGDDSYSDF